jgi:hypothetical protein
MVTAPRRYPTFVRALALGGAAAGLRVLGNLLADPEPPSATGPK